MRVLIVILSCFQICAFAQSADNIRYFKYRDKRDQAEVSQEKAKYRQQTITNADGSVTTEWTYLRNSTVIQSESYRADTPVGLWIYRENNGKVRAQLDYRFVTKYSETKCSSGHDFSMQPNDTLKGFPAHAFIAPKLIGQTSLIDYLIHALHYPEIPRDAGIEGRTVMSGKLNKEGIINDIVIIKSSGNLQLDVEAMRVFYGAREWTPAKLNGQPVELCITLPVSFKLD